MRVGNFSGDAHEAHKMGKEKFFESLKGKFNGDLKTLWESIEKEVGATEPTKKKKNQ